MNSKAKRCLRQVNSKEITREELFILLLKTLIEKFEEKQLESYEIERFIKEVPTENGWLEPEATGVEEIRVLFNPKNAHRRY